MVKTPSRDLQSYAKPWIQLSRLMACQCDQEARQMSPFRGCMFPHHGGDWQLQPQVWPPHKLCIETGKQCHNAPISWAQISTTILQRAWLLKKYLVSAGDNLQQPMWRASADHSDMRNYRMQLSTRMAHDDEMYGSTWGTLFVIETCITMLTCTYANQHVSTFAYRLWWYRFWHVLAS